MPFPSIVLFGSHFGPFFNQADSLSLYNLEQPMGGCVAGNTTCFCYNKLKTQHKPCRAILHGWVAFKFVSKVSLQARFHARKLCFLMCQRQYKRFQPVSLHLVSPCIRSEAILSFSVILVYSSLQCKGR